jgi:hypothetical protein
MRIKVRFFSEKVHYLENINWTQTHDYTKETETLYAVNNTKRENITKHGAFQCLV